MAIDSNGILHIDYDNETFDEILDNVATVLMDYRVTTDPGQAARDVGILCTSTNINKWARFKPIEYPKDTPLLESEYKGTLSQNLNNIYYGITVPASGNATLTSELEVMHDATFKYNRPTTRFRLSDFDGYNPNAEPNPYASFNRDTLVGFVDDADFETGGLTGISFRYYETNNTGVDFTHVLQDASLGTEHVLKSTYPCILITDEDGETYLTALFCTEDDGTKGPRPILKNGIYAGIQNWYVKFAKNVQSTTSTGDAVKPPWTTAQKNMRATLIMVRSASSSAPILVPGGTNFGDVWLHLDELGHPSAASPTVIPGAVGKSLTLKKYSTPDVTFAPTRVEGSVMNNNPQFFVHYEEIEGGETTSDIELQCAVSLDSPQGGPYIATKTIKGWPPSTGQVQVAMFTIAANDIMHTGTKTYEGKVSIRTTVGTKSVIKTMTFSVTI